MSAVLEISRELHNRNPEPRHAGLRTITIGILGLGQVGQAVARLAADAARLRDAGYRVRVTGALVRRVDTPRRCVRPARLTTNPSAFLRGHYDVVVEALGTIEPARSIVRRLLGRGVPVVSANKALIAAHGPELAALAARKGTRLRYEASALAGVPFLGALAARPLVSDVTQFAAIVNGTSNFILSTIDRDGGTVDDVVHQARARGLTEPDASRDLDGLDAADKLALLASVFGWGTLPTFRLDVQGIRDLTPQDLAVARSLDGTIKPIVFAARGGAGISAFVGPALVPARHPLAAIDGTLSGIHLSGRFVPDLFFSGPGAGPEITAATILDDVIEAASAGHGVRPARHVHQAAALAAPPPTRWLIRARFPGVVPDEWSTKRTFEGHDLRVLHVTGPHENQRWALVDTTTRDVVDRALAQIADTHRVRCVAVRAL